MLDSFRQHFLPFRLTQNVNHETGSNCGYFFVAKELWSQSPALGGRARLFRLKLSRPPQGAPPCSKGSSHNSSWSEMIEEMVGGQHRIDDATRNRACWGGHRAGQRSQLLRNTKRRTGVPGGGQHPKKKLLQRPTSLERRVNQSGVENARRNRNALPFRPVFFQTPHPAPTSDITPPCN